MCISAWGLCNSMMRKRKGFGQFFLRYPFLLASRRNARFPENFDWHVSIGSEVNQICQKSIFLGYCVVEKVDSYTALIVLYHSLNKFFLPLSYMAFWEANYRNSVGESFMARNICCNIQYCNYLETYHHFTPQNGGMHQESFCKDDFQVKCY